MIPLTIKHITFGTGLPKLCIPLTGTCEDELLQEIKALAALPVDVLEWRLDYISEKLSPDKLIQTAFAVQRAVGERILLLTFPTKEQGGRQALPHPEINRYLRLLAEVGIGDIYDVEYTGKLSEQNLLRQLQGFGKKVLLSRHYLNETPPRNHLQKELLCMANWNVDLLKLAVTPTCPADVLQFLCFIEEATTQEATPIIAIAMGKLGKISRLCAELTGSVMTFAKGKQTTAPGQMDTLETAEILKLLHF